MAANSERYVMKNFLKLIGILTLAAIIGFSVFACNEEEGNGNGNGGPFWDVDDYVDIGPGPFTAPQPFNDTNAVDFVAGMKLGWNLGNTLDAGGQYNLDRTVTQLETAWVSHLTNAENIKTLRAAGFDTIRIPVTWRKVTGPAPDYKIREDWMARVTEIVNYAVGCDMYVILNTHHDEGLFRFLDSNTPAGIAAFTKIWEQIADQFKNYNEKLIFEALNEPRTIGTQANPWPSEWSGGTAEERANINKYYEAFINIVRNSGGNNNKRFLLFATYAASVEAPAVDGLVLPVDIVADKLIVSVHYYSPYEFALSRNDNNNTWDKDKIADFWPINQGLDRPYNKFVKNGIPVIVGEFGAMNKNNEEVRAEWAEYYVSEARKREMPCIWWDNSIFVRTSPNQEIFGLLDRPNNTFAFPLVLEGLLKGAGLGK